MKLVTLEPPFEIRRKGFQVLCKSLGPANALRFLLQYEPGQGNYTKERQRRIARRPVADILKQPGRR